MDQTWTISIRIPADLADWIKAQAEEATRTYNGQIVHLLKLARTAVESASPTPPARE